MKINFRLKILQDIGLIHNFLKIVKTSNENKSNHLVFSDRKKISWDKVFEGFPRDFFSLARRRIASYVTKG